LEKHIFFEAISTAGAARLHTSQHNGIEVEVWATNTNNSTHILIDDDEEILDEVARDHFIELGLSYLIEFHI